jgi:hypothetical protein
MIDVSHFSRLPRSARPLAAGSRFVGARFRRCLGAAEHRSADRATKAAGQPVRKQGSPLTVPA